MNNKKDFEEFTMKLADKLQIRMKQEYGLSVDAETHLIQKTNVEKQGITVKFADSVIAPTVYTDDFYQMYKEGKPIEDIAKKLSKSILKAHDESPILPVLTQEEAKRHITLTLVNTEMNQQLLEKTPHMEILNGELSAVPRWYISDDASFIVSNELASRMMLTPDEVLRIGQENINVQNFEAKPMREILIEMMGSEYADMLPPTQGMEMIVLSSPNRVQGSNALLSNKALDHVHDLIGDYAIIPSSIHEVICVPIMENMKPEDLRDMVHEVNGTQVAPEERLSENIMKYDGEKLSLVGESFKMENRKVDITMGSHSIKFAM